MASSQYNAAPCNHTCLPMNSPPDNEFLLIPISDSSRKLFMLAVAACFLGSGVFVILGGHYSLVTSSKCSSLGKWISFAIVAAALLVQINDTKATKTMIEKWLLTLSLRHQSFLGKNPGLRKSVVAAFFLLVVVPFLWIVIAWGASSVILLSSLPVSGHQTTTEMLITRSVGHSSGRSGCFNSVYVEGPMMFNTICRVPEQVRSGLNKGDSIIAHGIANSWGMRVKSIQALP